MAINRQGSNVDLEFGLPNVEGLGEIDISHVVDVIGKGRSIAWLKRRLKKGSISEEVLFEAMKQVMEDLLEGANYPINLPQFFLWYAEFFNEPLKQYVRDNPELQKEIVALVKSDLQCGNLRPYIWELLSDRSRKVFLDARQHMQVYVRNAFWRVLSYQSYQCGRNNIVDDPDNFLSYLKLLLGLTHEETLEELRQDEHVQRRIREIIGMDNLPEEALEALKHIASPEVCKEIDTMRERNSEQV